MLAPSRLGAFYKHSASMKLESYGRCPHIIWETAKLTPKEKMLLAYLIDRSNKFCKENCEFNMTLKDFNNIGINDKGLLRKYRKKLIEYRLINYTEGHTGKGSTYLINWDNIYNLDNIEMYSVDTIYSKECLDIINRHTEEIEKAKKDLKMALSFQEKERPVSVDAYYEEMQKQLKNVCISEGLHSTDKLTQEIYDFVNNEVRPKPL